MRNLTLWVTDKNFHTSNCQSPYEGVVQVPRREGKGPTLFSENKNHINRQICSSLRVKQLSVIENLVLESTKFSIGHCSTERKSKHGGLTKNTW